MKMTIGSKIAVGFLIALVAMIIMSAFSENNLAGLSIDTFWVTHTVEVRGRLESFRGNLLDAEGAARGFALVRDAGFERVAEGSLRSARTDIDAVRDLVRDNPVQEVLVGQADRLLTERSGQLQQIFASKDGIGSTREFVRQSQATAATIRELVGKMMAEERRLLEERQSKAVATAVRTHLILTYGTVAALLGVFVTGWLVTRSITRPLRTLARGAEIIGKGDYAHRVQVKSRDETGELAALFNQMASQVQQRQSSLEEEAWLKNAMGRLAMLFQGRRDTESVARDVLAELADLLDARRSGLYVPRRDGTKDRLRIAASYGCESLPASLAAGEGLVGQCWLEKKSIILEGVANAYFKIGSSLGDTLAATVVLIPALFEGRVEAVLEIATWKKLRPIDLTLLDQLSHSLGVVLKAIESGQMTEVLLRKSQELSEDLQRRQTELRDKNQQLETQTDQLRQSELRLQEQQEELKQTNEELEQSNEEMQQTNEEMEEKVNLLAEQKQEMEKANREIARAREALEEKAWQVAQASRYKSEFLANMSHELRTPLNSLLILSKLLADNSEHNLTAKQVQYARTINSSGGDLLEMINEILDLARIESGVVQAEIGPLNWPDLREFIEHTFRPVAVEKRLDFEISLDPGLPDGFMTDGRRLKQVLKNLLSNAFKFTSQGSVRLALRSVSAGWDRTAEPLNRASQVISFEVSDSGIGIAAEKQHLIFEAFRQADTGTARKYGGTGLGLAISRQLTELLGGSLKVSSQPGHGSTFTLYLPLAAATNAVAMPAPVKASVPEEKEEGALPEDRESGDDRANLKSGDRILLIIEDDRAFSGILMDFARDKKFKVVVARTGAQGIVLARKVRPSAITLDLRLPDSDGWLVLDRLKHDPQTRHIPTHIISVAAERERSLSLGAVSFLQKPVSKESLDAALVQTIDFLERPIKNLLVVEDDAVQRQSIVELIGNGDVKSTAVGTAAEAFAALDQKPFDCIVLDIGLPDLNGVELIREIQKRHGHLAPPIIVYTGRELSRVEETELRMISDSIVIKNVRSPERLLDETALFLHRVQNKLAPSKQRIIEEAHKQDMILAGKKVLVVDDDVRNIFALTAVLEESGMRVLYAESGQQALDSLAKSPDVSVILMDVMMPEMDGFEAIRRIRKMDGFRKLPIISVTAKAMKDDRAKCLEAGASDYITKPVDTDQLRSLLRVWLYS